MKVMRKWFGFHRKHEALFDNKARLARFVDTITAGTLVFEQPGHDFAVFERWENIAQLDLVAHSRRLFITRSGALGLGHATCRKGDLICVLMGPAVPYSLRRGKHDGPDIRHSTPVDCFWSCHFAPHKGCCMPTVHRLIGQAYVKSLMAYNGDILEDRASGKLKLTEYLLE